MRTVERFTVVVVVLVAAPVAAAPAAGVVAAVVVLVLLPVLTLFPAAAAGTAGCEETVARAAAAVAGGATGKASVLPGDLADGEEATFVRLPFADATAFFSFGIGSGEPMRYLWLDARFAKGDRTGEGGASRE